MTTEMVYRTSMIRTRKVMTKMVYSRNMMRDDD